MDYTLGQAAIVSKGAWSASVTYNALNTVTHNGGSFMAIAQNSGVEPGVTSGWASSWVNMTKGIKAISVTAVDSATAQMTVTFSDGTTATGGTFNTATIADGSIATAKLADRSVTGAKVALSTIKAENLNNILPENVGIKYGTAVPSASTISSGQIYLKYA